MLSPIYVIDSLLSSCEFPIQTGEVNIEKKFPSFYLKGFVPEVRRGSMRSPGNLRSRRIFVLENKAFEAMSKRAWTDVLLQMYKVNCRYIYYHILGNWWLKALFWKRSVIYWRFIFFQTHLVSILFLSIREGKKSEWKYFNFL